MTERLTTEIFTFQFQVGTLQEMEDVTGSPVERASGKGSLTSHVLRQESLIKKRINFIYQAALLGKFFILRGWWDWEGAFQTSLRSPCTDWFCAST